MHQVKMLRSIVVFVALVVALGYAQTPQHCISPPELTFKSIAYNHRLTEFRIFTGEYDAHNQRMALRGEEKEAGKPGSYHWLIALHKEEIIYEIDIDKKACHKFPFKKFYPIAVPENAKFEDAYEIGGPNESVEVEEWFEPHLFGGKFWVGVFSRKHCYPVSTFLYQDHHNETITTTYHNVVEGIISPDWFIPPSICNT